MIVTLRPEAEALLQEELSTGRFRDASEAIQAALLALREYAPEPFTDLDAHLQESFDDIAAGRLYTEEEARAYIALVRAKLDESFCAAEHGNSISAEEFLAGIDAQRAKIAQGDLNAYNELPTDVEQPQ